MLHARRIEFLKVGITVQKIVCIEPTTLTETSVLACDNVLVCFVSKPRVDIGTAKLSGSSVRLAAGELRKPGSLWRTA
jgi:hypothetical protein